MRCKCPCLDGARKSAGAGTTNLSPGNLELKSWEDSSSIRQYDMIQYIRYDTILSKQGKRSPDETIR